MCLVPIIVISMCGRYPGAEDDPDDLPALVSSTSEPDCSASEESESSDDDEAFPEVNEETRKVTTTIISGSKVLIYTREPFIIEFGNAPEDFALSATTIQSSSGEVIEGFSVPA